LVDGLASELDELIMSLGGGGWDDLDEATKAEIEAMQPKLWPLSQNNDVDPEGLT